MSAGHPRAPIELTADLRRDLARARRARGLPPYDAAPAAPCPKCGREDRRNARRLQREVREYIRNKERVG